MGDNIAFTPILRYFNSLGYKVYFKTSPTWKPMFDKLPYLAGVSDDYTPREQDLLVCPNPKLAAVIDPKYQNVISPLHKLSETKKRAKMSFAYRYMVHIGLQPEEHDLTTDFAFDEVDMQLPANAVVIALGSLVTPRRQLQPAFMRECCDRLAKDGWSPMIMCAEDTDVGNLPCYRCKFIDSNNLQKGLSIIKQCRVMITPDCGVLHARAALKLPLIALMSSHSPNQSFVTVANRIECYNGVHEIWAPDVMASTYVGQKRMCAVLKPLRQLLRCFQ